MTTPRPDDHPTELLAERVDGMLVSDDVARLEHHLETCERCRDELRLATEARARLLALPELPAPEHLPLAIRRADRQRFAGRTAWRAAGAVAVAAGVVGGIFGLARILDSDPADLTAGGGGGGAVEAPQPAQAEEEERYAQTNDMAKDETLAGASGVPPILPRYRESQRDLDLADLAPLARRLADEARGALSSGLAPTATAFFADFDRAAFTPEVRTAIRCVLEDVPPEQLVVPLEIQATLFQGEDVYIAAFLQGPAPDQPYDRVVIWVVDRQSCSLRSLSSQRL